MLVKVHVREKAFNIQCGDGGQRISWLGNVGISRYDRKNGMEVGIPMDIRLENGTRLNMDDLICSRLSTDAEVQFFKFPFRRFNFIGIVFQNMF